MLDSDEKFEVDILNKQISIFIEDHNTSNSSFLQEELYKIKNSLYAIKSVYVRFQYLRYVANVYYMINRSFILQIRDNKYISPSDTRFNIFVESLEDVQSCFDNLIEIIKISGFSYVMNYSYFASFYKNLLLWNEIVMKSKQLLKKEKLRLNNDLNAEINCFSQELRRNRKELCKIRLNKKKYKSRNKKCFRINCNNPSLKRRKISEINKNKYFYHLTLQRTRMKEVGIQNRIYFLFKKIRELNEDLEIQNSLEYLIEMIQKWDVKDEQTLRTNAILYFEKSIQLHTEGDEYKSFIRKMYILEDDMNDSRTHFNAALDRSLINVGRIPEKLEDLKTGLV